MKCRTTHGSHATYRAVLESHASNQPQYCDKTNEEIPCHKLSQNNIILLRPSSHGKFISSVAEGDDERLPGLRLPVDKMAEATWRRRANTDLFSGLRKAEVVKLYPENDHIWECQLLDKVRSELLAVDLKPALS